MCTSDLTAAISDFPLSLEGYVIRISFVGFLVPENICLTVGIVLLLCKRAKIFLFPIFAGRLFGFSTF